MAVVADPGLRLEPDLEGARRLAAQANVVPVRLRFVDDCETPVSALLKLRGEGPCFLLESAERGRRADPGGGGAGSVRGGRRIPEPLPARRRRRHAAVRRRGGWFLRLRPRA